MILWIDPWIRKLWYALTTRDMKIVDAWILLLDQKAPTRENQFERMEKIFDFFVKLLDEYTISAVWIEKLFFTKFNQSNAEFVYWIRWALLMHFVKHSVPVYERTPKEIKKRITWNGMANKILVQTMIQRLYNLKELPQPHDAADALGLCWMVGKIHK